MAKKKTKAPAPHPDLDDHILGVELGIADTKAKIQRQWESVFDVGFPGWSTEALRRVASYAKIPTSQLKPGSLFNAIRIYRAAIAKKKRPLVAVKSGKTLQLMEKVNHDDWIGPFRPSELAKRLDVSLSTYTRMRTTQEKLRVRVENTKRHFIHPDDLRRYEKK